MTGKADKNNISIVVDGRSIAVRPGTILLEACLDNDIYIPNLCHIEGADHPAASCRLCFVEIGGQTQPVAACTVRINAPMTVNTDTQGVRRLQRSAFNLLLSVHDVACKTCPANRQCALQDIARFLKVGLKTKGVPQRLKPQECIDTHPTIDYWPNRCVLCGQCINACQNTQGQPLMTFAGRGFDTMISFYASPDKSPDTSSGTSPNTSPDTSLGDFTCTHCTACIEVCPVGALTPKE